VVPRRGITWIVFAFFLLSFNYRTVWAIALIFGIGFIIGGIMELMIAAAAPRWRWLYLLIGIVSIIAGIIALIWPGQTFLVLSALAGWFLLFYGIIESRRPRRRLLRTPPRTDRHRCQGPRSPTWRSVRQVRCLVR